MQEKLNEHRATVLKFMDKRQAICIKDENEIAGVMLFSRGHNMICYLAVSPEYRRRGVASILMDEVLTNLDRTKEISVSTFRADDEKGTAPRALYEKYHLSPDDDYPEFKYYEGLPYLNDFYLEVHYEGTSEQDESIQRVLAERGKAKAGRVIKNTVLPTKTAHGIFCVFPILHSTTQSSLSLI